MKVFVTQYALTDGIIECEAKDTVKFNTIHVEYRKRGWGSIRKPDWWETKDAAIQRAKEMKAKKIIAVAILTIFFGIVLVFIIGSLATIPLNHLLGGVGFFVAIVLIIWAVLTLEAEWLK